MPDEMEVYPHVLRDGQWWLPYGTIADAEMLAALFRSDCNVAFHWPEGGSFAFTVTEEGEEVVRIDHGGWHPISSVSLTVWQEEALALVMQAIDQM